MKDNRMKLVGISALALICLMIIPSMAGADEITWGDPIILDFDIHNKNKWIAETDIQMEGQYFDTIAMLMFMTDEPPSNLASIQIKGLLGKEYVNITQNVTNSGSWNIYYLSEPISITPGENYTIKVVIKAAETSTPSETIITGTRAEDIGPSNDPLDYTLFKIGSSGNLFDTSAPVFDTGGGSGADTGDYDYPAMPGNPEPSEVNYMALFGIFLILISFTGVSIFKLPPMVWFVVGLLISLLSMGGI